MRQVRTKKQWGKWLLTIWTVIWMVVIFSFSAQPAEESSKTSRGVGGMLVKIFVPDFEEWSGQEQAAYVEKINHPIRKMGHATEYAILGGSLVLTLRAWGMRGKKTVGYAAVSGGLYASTDEFHQLFVPGRGAQVTDVLIDSAGVLAGAAAVFLILLAVERKRKIKKTAADETEYETQWKEEGYGKKTGADFDENTAAGGGAV